MKIEIIVAGDYNIAHKEIDIHDPKGNKKSSGFLPEERAWMDHFLDNGWVDSFRKIHPESTGAYSWLNGRIKSLKVLGYADCRGDVKSNIILSTKRAQFIASNLVTLGVVGPDFKIEVVGNGELPCIGVEEFGNSKDRRVDVIMTYEVINEIEGTDVPVDPMQQMIETGRLELVGVNFQPGLRYFLPGVEAVLDAFAESLKKMPNIKIELQGHICCHGKQGDGMDIETGMENLSVMRAKEVHDYLIAKGVDKKRLVYKGLGNNFPKVWPEMSNADQIANRRVEAVVWE